MNDRHLPHALLRAAERCLVVKSSDELTRQEIAAAAGTNSAMIGYYFQSKEGLFRELLAELMRDMCAKIDELERSFDLDGRTPTRRIVERLAALYRANAGACRVLSVELTKSRSAIKRDYMSRDAGLIVDRIAALLKRLVDLGIYAPEAELRNVAITIRLLVSHSLIGPSAWSLPRRPGESANEEVAHAAWLDHVVDLLDRQLCPRACGSQEPAKP